ncbi:MAG: hypothetical protein QXD48_02310 [Candidatus Aenigmatarchaeota archaeon]
MVKILSFFIALILFFSYAHAIGIGSSIRNNYIKIIENETVTVKAIFWNRENNTYEIEIYAKDVPENFSIFIEPNKFLLNRTTGSEYIILPSPNEVISATPVLIKIFPIGAIWGQYNITIIAKIVLPENKITFLQEQEFRLIIDTDKQNYNEKNEHVNNISIIETDKENDEQKDNNYIIAIFIILLISVIIYKLA